MLCEEYNKLPLSVVCENLEWSLVLLFWSPSLGTTRPQLEHEVLGHQSNTGNIRRRSVCRCISSPTIHLSEIFDVPAHHPLAELSAKQKYYEMFIISSNLPPFPRRKWKNLSLHTHRLHVRYQETVKDFQIHPERKSSKRPGLRISIYLSKLYLPEDMLTFSSHISRF